ncbi:MAG: MraY family glycosyltransferase [Candidatus Firestonebacteria bacterium]
MTKPHLFILVSSLIASFFVTPFVKKLALKAKAVDMPTHRKVHHKIIPRWGGLAIYTGFFLSLLLLFVLNDSFKKLLELKHYFLGWQLLGIFVAGTVIVIVGMLDDKFGLPPKIKLSGQIISALILVAFGTKFSGITLPFTKSFLELHSFLGIGITVFWVVLLINSFNFVDGLDGLASGLAIITAITFFCISLEYLPIVKGYMVQKSLVFTAILSLALVGSALGFLRYNFNPARIFMGDTGSQFLGLILASITIIGAFKRVSTFAIFVPLFAVAIPIADTGYAIIRRIKKKTPISMPDKKHFHHQLLAIGFSQKQAVVILYLISAILAAFAVFLTKYK